MTPSMMILAQAIAPPWVVLLAAYLLIAPGPALAAAIGATIVAFRSTNRRLALSFSGFALALGCFDVALALVFRSLDRQGTPLAPEDVVFAAMLVATLVLGAVATWRATRTPHASAAPEAESG